MNSKGILLGFGLLAALSCAAAQVQLVRDGRAAAQIVVPEVADATETFAAHEIQKWVGEITGAFVPVEKTASAKEGVPAVYVGAEFAKKRFPKDFKAIGRTDGFAVRNAEEGGVPCAFVFGGTVKGTLHGAYAFLERNSDIIWPRPNPRLAAVHSQSRDFTAADVDFVDVPRTKMREWQWNGGPGKGRYDWDKLWAARNRQNLNADGPAELSSSFLRYGPGHGVQRYAAPKRNFAAHPEWFPFIDGKRTTEGGMLCLTAYDMLPEYLANLTNDLANAFHGTPPARIKVDYLNVSLADNGMLCKCEKCMAPFVCENGVVVQPGESGFRSAQYFTFMNKLARMLAKTHPNVSLGTYAYAVTKAPPPFKIEKNVCVQLCLTELDERSPLQDEARNAGSKRLVDAWTDKCPGIWYRDYTGLSGRTDRAIEYPFAEGARYCMERRNPVMAYSAEHPRDRADANATIGSATEAWDVSGMSTWVMSRLWWNPYEDVDALRRQYVKRTYREAAPQMQRYHDAMRDAFRADRMPTMFLVGSPVFLTKRYVVDAGLAEKMRGFLKDALAAAKHPVSAELIRRQLAHFERNCARAAAIPDYAIAAKPLSAGWDAAVESAPFVTAVPVYGRVDTFGETAKFRTTFKAAYDDKALHLRMRCEAPDAMTLKGDEDPTHHSPSCIDRLEFFIGRADAGVYWHWIMDPGVDEKGGGAVYKAKVNDTGWRGKWTRDVTRDANAWTVTMHIPFADLELEGAPKELLFNCFRDRKYPSGRKNSFGREIEATERSSWTGGGLHDPGGFGRLKFAK